MTTFAGEITQKIKQVSWSQVFMPRLEDILFLTLFFAVIMLGPRLMNMDGDLGRHLTIGKFIVENRTIPTRDIFSHTMQGSPLTPHEWLAQVTFALTYQTAGLNGVVIFCALLISITFTLVYRQCLTRSKMLLVSLGMTVIGAAAASIHWLARPHLFTMLFTVIWIGELEKWRTTGKWRMWILPILMLAWVNFHGAFIVGILIWLIYFLDHLYTKQNLSSSKNEQSSQPNERKKSNLQTRNFLIVGFVVILLTFLNPAGWRIWETTFGFLQNQYLVSHTIEYQSPNFQEINAWPFLGMIWLSILMLSLHRRELSLAVVLLLTFWTVFGLVSARNIAVYAVVAAPLLAGIGATILLDTYFARNIINFDRKLRIIDRNLIGYLWSLVGVFVIAGLVIGGFTLDTSGLGNRFSENVFPVEAVDWILEQPEQGRVFNYFPWGGYLLYRAWPQQEVFIDGQTDFYGEDLTRQYEKVIVLEDGWQEVLEKYEVDWVIMPVDSDLALELNHHPSWERRYVDQTAAVYFTFP
jgi:hypothetical protein